MDTGDVGCSPWGRKELGTTELLTLTYTRKIPRGFQRLHPYSELTLEEKKSLKCSSGTTSAQRFSDGFYYLGFKTS